MDVGLAAALGFKGVSDSWGALLVGLMSSIDSRTQIFLTSRILV